MTKFSENWFSISQRYPKNLPDKRRNGNARGAWLADDSQLQIARYQEVPNRCYCYDLYHFLEKDSLRYVLSESAIKKFSVFSINTSVYNPLISASFLWFSEILEPRVCFAFVANFSTLAVDVFLAGAGQTRWSSLMSAVSCLHGMLYFFLLNYVSRLLLLCRKRSCEHLSFLIFNIVLSFSEMPLDEEGRRRGISLV